MTGYYFAERKEFLYFYMGYPNKSQARKISPFGSAQAVATQALEQTADIYTFLFYNLGLNPQY